jgi:alginate O-acetyltransferase complex protein AlgI
MTFNSLQYFAFFAVVLVVYFRLGLKGQNRLMVLGGAVFYGAFDWRFLFLLYGSTIVDFVVGRQLAISSEDRRRKQLLAVSVAFNLGVLGFFKYADFFADSAADALGAVGLEADPFTLNVILPVGISFYTFQTLAYAVAVYRRQIEPERDIVTFAAFVSWFPQLVAGPIERASTLLPQIQRRRERPSWAVVESGAVLILRGLFKKVVIADSVAAYVNGVYLDPAGFRWTALVLATVGFAVQVYGDFSGYTDIARGSSRLLGVELRRNFEQPFLSRDIREFWQRWHTSLNWWFLEMVAQPIRATRRSPAWAGFTVLLIFSLIGLWHGAAWTFVFWGFLNGVLVTIWRRVPRPAARHPMRLRIADIPHIAFTFALFCLGVAFFRARSFGDAIDVLQGIATMQGGTTGPSGAPLVPLVLVAVLILDLVERRRRIQAIEGLRVRASLGGVATPPEAVAESMTGPMGSVAAGLTVAVMVLGLVVFSGGTPTPFIYFQF